MKRSPRTPIAWLQLSHRPMKLIAAVAGVSFANVLVFFQLGLSGALYDSQKRPIEQLNGELAMIPRRYTNLGEPLRFQRAQLARVRGIAGVQSVSPLHVGKIDWINTDTRETKQALVFGVDPSNPALKLPALKEQRAQLQLPNSVLFDTSSKKAAGPVSKVVSAGGIYDTELRGQQAKVTGLFKLGLTFAADINLITSTTNFQVFFPDSNRGDIQLGVIKLQPKANVARVQASINSILDPSLKVLTIKELQQQEMNHWRKNTSFGLIFNLGVLVGLAVGSIIVYQILYSEVGDHLGEYATMKAMGYSDRIVVGIIVQESIILATLAFLPSLILSIALYQILMRSTGLLVVMSIGRAAMVFILTLLLCSGSGWLATSKLRRLDPADVF
ncbi:MAG: ABC transporter permease DevC [Prochlorococcus sp.]